MRLQNKNSFSNPHLFIRWSVTITGSLVNKINFDSF